MNVASRSNCSAADESSSPITNTGGGGGAGGWLRQISFSNLSRIGSSRTLNSRSMQQLNRFACEENDVIDRTPDHNHHHNHQSNHSDSLYFSFDKPEPESNYIHFPGPLYQSYVQEYLLQQQQQHSGKTNVADQNVEPLPNEQDERQTQSIAICEMKKNAESKAHQINTTKLFVQQTYKERQMMLESNEPMQALHTQTLPRYLPSRPKPIEIPANVFEQPNSKRANQTSNTNDITSNASQIVSRSISQCAKTEHSASRCSSNEPDWRSSLKRQIEQTRRNRDDKANIPLHSSQLAIDTPQSNGITSWLLEKAATQSNQVVRFDSTPPSNSVSTSIGPLVRDWSGAIVEPVRPCNNHTANKVITDTNGFDTGRTGSSSKTNTTNSTNSTHDASASASARRFFSVGSSSPIRSKPIRSDAVNRLDTNTLDADQHRRRTSHSNESSANFAKPPSNEHDSLPTNSNQAKRDLDARTIRPIESSSDCARITLNSSASTVNHISPQLGASDANCATVNSERNNESNKMVIGLGSWGRSSSIVNVSLDDIHRMLHNNPRLCVMHLSNANDELGFNLITKKRPVNAHLLVKINPKSVAARSGLVEHDQILAVDGIDCRSFTHQQVVKCIRNRTNMLQLLVCPPALYQWTVRNQVRLDMSIEPAQFIPTEQTPHSLYPLFESGLCTPDGVRKTNAGHSNQYIPYADYDAEDDTGNESSVEPCANENKLKYDGGRFDTSRSIHLQDRQPRLHIPNAISTPVDRSNRSMKDNTLRTQSPLDFSRIHGSDDQSTNGSLNAYDEKYDQRYDEMFSREQQSISNSYSFETKRTAYTSESRHGPYDNLRSSHRSVYTKQTQKPADGLVTTTESFEDEKLTTTCLAEPEDVIRTVPATKVPTYKPYQSQSLSKGTAVPHFRSGNVSRSVSNLPNTNAAPSNVDRTGNALRNAGSASATDLRPSSWKGTATSKTLPTLVERPSVGSVDVPISVVPGQNDLPAPRLCVLKLPPGSNVSYGFTVKTDKKTNAKSLIEIGRDSVAERAGLRSNDILIEVNGVNVSIDNHKQVTERIKSQNNNDLELLVLTDLEHEMYLKRNVIPKSNQKNILRMENLPQLSAPERIHVHDRLDSDEKVAVPTGFWGNFLNNLSARQYQSYLRNKRKPDPRQTNLEFQDKIKFFEKL